MSLKCLNCGWGGFSGTLVIVVKSGCSLLRGKNKTNKQTNERNKKVLVNIECERPYKTPPTIKTPELKGTSHTKSIFSLCCLQCSGFLIYRFTSKPLCLLTSYRS